MTVQYRVMSRREPDAIADVTIERSETGTTIKAKSTQNLRISVPPYSAAGPTWQYRTATTEMQ